MPMQGYGYPQQGPSNPNYGYQQQGPNDPYAGYQQQGPSDPNYAYQQQGPGAPNYRYPPPGPMTYRDSPPAQDGTYPQQLRRVPPKYVQPPQDSDSDDSDRKYAPPETAPPPYTAPPGQGTRALSEDEHLADRKTGGPYRRDPVTRYS
ncbi:hypothetical protein CALVIDRAFT_535024 [Calocera viscosa TUFC12733]|uniref:Uncharacterized protein n=1 Tax=Calocera viscosa (strain TUFC12733) TaxID=1330018 RepID=A0A167PLI1_CALVF|nr:hypothetical protein CALVIDRAFT_535024 [Calocera viscosa TUFC12733]